MLIEPQASPGFVETPGITTVVNRALIYLEAGLAVNLSGPSGVGKTTLALHVASQLGRPVIFIAGDEQFRSGDMAGGLFGYRRRRVVDNFIRSVLKTDDDFMERWVDSRLTMACQYGFTLVYDEFTRSRPEANNALLTVLEEGMLVMPSVRGGEGYVKVDPRFRAIFTSNPLEYSGTHRPPDALRDRLITLHLGYYDEETEVSITVARSGLDWESAKWAVKLMRLGRTAKGLPGAVSTRGCIAVAKVMEARGMTPDPNDELLYAVCRDVLSSGCTHVTGEEEMAVREVWHKSFCTE
jgi:gas vesicle protein GvpN